MLDYVAANIGAVLYASAANQAGPDVINSSGTHTAAQLAHQKLIETYFPRLKFKGTPRSFEALGKLLGFDDVRMVPLWGRVSPRLPNDPGAPVNDADFSQVPEFYPQQELSPFYQPSAQRDGPYFAWFGTVDNGTASTAYYPQVVNGFQPWVRFQAEVSGISRGTLVPAAAGTYALEGGAPHAKASVILPSTGTFYSLGEGEAWNGVQITVSDFGGTLRRLDITDRLSSVKYRTSFFDLGVTMDADKADALFGTQAARSNKDVALAPHAYVSWGGTLTGTSPYRPFVGGTPAFQSVTGEDNVDFLTPFSGTVVYYRQRTEATLGDAQQNYPELAKAGQGVVQALEEVRPATRFPRRASYGYLMSDEAQYAPITAYGSVLSASVGITSTAAGTFHRSPLPPYTTGVLIQAAGSSVNAENSTDSRWPSRVIHKYAGAEGTLQGFTVPSAGSYNLQFSEASKPSVVSVEFFGTIGANNDPCTPEVVRSDAFTGTQVFAAIADYGLASNFGAGNPAQRVADRVHSWKPDLIITLGDNNYYDGLPSTIHANNTGYWNDIQQGRVYPALGNHDLNYDSGETQITYFFNGTTPGNGRYYNVRRGLVEFFCLNPGWSSAMVPSATGDASYATTTEPDGNTFTSEQGLWLKEALRRSTAPWKIVFFHFPPYVSSTSSSNYAPGYPRMRWPFREWGATGELCIKLSPRGHATSRRITSLQRPTP